MKVELKQAIEAYGKGLEEVSRLVTDDATVYGVPLGGAVTSASTGALAQLLEQSFLERDQIDEDALAESIAELDPARYVSSFPGGTPAYLSLLLGGLYTRVGRPDEAEEGMLTSPVGPELVEWLHRLFLKAGYTQDDLDVAWQRFLLPFVSLWRRQSIAEEAIARAYLRQQVGALLDAIPVDTRARVLDNELTGALEEIGIGFAEMVDFGYQDEDGQTQHVTMLREDYEREVSDVIASYLLGRKPVASDGSPFRHVVTSAPSSRNRELRM